MRTLGATGAQWVIIGLAGAIAVAGFGLMAINVAGLFRSSGTSTGGPRKPFLGRPRQMTRRAFFRKALGAAFGFAMFEGFGLGSLAFLWPSLSGGFGGEITLAMSADDIKAQIRSTKLPFYYAPGRFYLVEYDPAQDVDGIYTSKGLVADGLMALYQRCVHLGCRVPFCQASQWFECPCHGSKYNRAGEYQQGPAPRGLDRFPIKAEGSSLKVNTGIIETGPSRGTNTTGQNPEGPFCVTPAGSHH
ncbi:MAG: Rieske 2Fe-2S domain-containing protein [Actinomycetota bacterium]